jgi:F-type H+-transporting ATPase subunit c
VALHWFHRISVRSVIRAEPQPKGESIVKRFYLAVFISIVALFVAFPVLAENGTGSHWHYITIGFAMAFASAICGLAQGRAISSACESLARNPGAAAAIRFALLLGLVLIESLVLYTLLISFLLYFKLP